MSTASERARQLKLAHPELSYSQIAERTGLTKQGAANACARASGKRGRPVLTQADRIAQLQAQLSAVRAIDPDAQCKAHGCALWRCTDKH